MKAIFRGGPMHRKVRHFPKLEQKIIIDMPSFPSDDIIGSLSVSTIIPRREGEYSRVIDPVRNKQDTYYFVWLGWKNA